MKDATGELSMTAIAVVAIAAIGLLFTTLVWPQIRTSILRSTYCNQAFNCKASEVADNMYDCSYCEGSDTDGDVAGCETVKTIQCARNDKATE